MSTASHSTGTASFARDSEQATQSPYIRLYADALRGLDNPFAQFLKKLHGVAGTVKVGHASGIGSYLITAEIEATEALQMLARDAEHPRFKDRWARALTYRYRPLEEATPTNRADDTVREVIQQAEDWVDTLYEAMCNVERVHNKPTSIELSMFRSPSLDKKAVEAACRSILIALIHRCIIGFCGLRVTSSVAVTREDKRMTCKERLLAVTNALKFDKRICKDVMTEDSKVFHLVHAPLGLLKCKRSQEKGNDVKRDLLAAGAAVRRKVHQSSARLESPQKTMSMKSSPTPIHADNLMVRDTLATVSQYPSPAIPAPVTTGSTCSLAEGLNVLSSSSFAASNEERASKKRKPVHIASGNIEEAKRARTKVDKDGSAARAAVKRNFENADDVVYVGTMQTTALLDTD